MMMMMIAHTHENMPQRSAKEEEWMRVSREGYAYTA
jgi:hypothetical protein